MLEKARGRLVIDGAGFVVLFLAVLAKLTDATILDPLMPRRRDRRSPSCWRR